MEDHTPPHPHLGTLGPMQPYPGDLGEQWPGAAQPPKAAQRGATCAWKRTRHAHLHSQRTESGGPRGACNPFAQTGTQLGGCFSRLGLPVTVGRAKSLVPRVGEYVCLKRRQHRVTYSSRSHTYIYQRPPLGGAAKCELTQNGHVDMEPCGPAPSFGGEAYSGKHEFTHNCRLRIG